MLLVREVSGPARARVGETLVYTATRFNQERPSATDLAAINWVIKQGEQQLATGIGPSISFTPDPELAGTALIAMAYRNSPSPSVSATTFIQALPKADVFREQLKAIGAEYPDLLDNPSEDLSIQELASQATALRYDLEDLLESLGPLPDDDLEAREAEEEAAERPRLAIVVGHTAKRPGAVAGPPINEQEYSWNLDLAQQIKAAGEASNIEIKICLRDEVGIAGAYAAATAFEPAAIIELHFNSYSSPAAKGAETLYADAHPKSRTLAALVQKHMLAALGPGRSDRGVKQIVEGGRGYRNLTAAAAVATCLVEPFFGSNEDDCRAAMTNKTAYASALVDAALAFMDD